LRLVAAYESVGRFGLQQSKVTKKAVAAITNRDTGLLLLLAA